MTFDPRGFEKAMKAEVCPHFGDKAVCDACQQATGTAECGGPKCRPDNCICPGRIFPTLPEVAASLGEQIRRLEQLMAVVRTMARKLGMDWQDVIDRTEKHMWAEQERDKLRGGTQP